MGHPRKILQVTSYPPPRAGWGVRVEFLKKRLESEGHRCVVINIGPSRCIPSAEYETVIGVADFVRKVWRFSRQGFIVHAHANGDSLKGLLLALAAELINLAAGRRCCLTFHAGVIQRYFPGERNRWLVPVFWLLFTIPRRIVCNSEAVKARIVGYGISPGKITPIAAFSRQYLEFTRVPLPVMVERFFARYPSVVFTYARMRTLFYPVTMINGMAIVMRSRPEVGLILCGGTGHSDHGVWRAVQTAIEQHGIGDRVCFVDDLDHDAFMTVLERSALYLRTPITDGVASSVLEALALGIPVVACDNGTRPAGVMTFPATDPTQLALAVEATIARRADAVAAIGAIALPDTLADEVSLLTS
jgi:glycosyltransferase involved in cell wall biosynthesis